MEITARKIFKLRDEWQSYMDESWDRGKKSIDFIEKSDQYAGDDKSLSFEALSFNFMYKLLKTAQATGKDIDLSLSLNSDCSNREKEETTFRRIFHQIMMNENHRASFSASLDKSYVFGQAVYQIKVVRENEKTLNDVLEIENIEDVTTTFFDPASFRHDFRDGNFCGRTYEISGKTLKKLYSNCCNMLAEKQVYEVADFWFKEKKLVNYVAMTNGQYIREDLINPLKDLKLLSAKKIKKGTTTSITYCRSVKGEGIYIFLEKQKNLRFTRLPMIFNSGGVVWDGETRKFTTYPFGYHLQDTQIFMNYTGSAMADMMKSTKSDRWIFKAEHVASKAAKDAADEINTREGGLIFTGETETIRREVSQQMPPSMPQTFNQLQETIQMLSGSYFENGADKIKAVSGVALDKLFNRVDLIQNPVILAHLEAINEIGRTLKEMIPTYYYQNRTLCVKNESGTQEKVEINKSVENPGGGYIIENNIKDLASSYDYTVKISPSKRLQNQNTQIELEKLYQLSPEAIRLTSDLYAKSLDIPISEVLAKRLGANIPVPLIEYSNGDIPYEQYEKEYQKFQDSQQKTVLNSPENRYLQAKTQKETAQAGTEKGKSQIDMYNAETDRLKEMSESDNRHIRSVSEAAKVSMENANTQHAQKVSLIEKIIEHRMPLEERSEKRLVESPTQ